MRLMRAPMTLYYLPVTNPKKDPTVQSEDKKSRECYETPKLKIFGHVGTLSQAGTGPMTEFMMGMMDDTNTMRQRV